MPEALHPTLAPEYPSIATKGDGRIAAHSWFALAGNDACNLLISLQTACNGCAAVM